MLYDMARRMYIWQQTQLHGFMLNLKQVVLI